MNLFQNFAGVKWPTKLDTPLNKTDQTNKPIKTKTWLERFAVDLDVVWRPCLKPIIDLFE